MDKQKLLSLLGLSMRARKIVSGELAVETAVRSGKAKLVIIAADASEGTKKSYRDMTSYYNVSIYEGPLKEELGSAIGKASRAAVAVMDTGFSKAIIKSFIGNIEGE